MKLKVIKKSKSVKKSDGFNDDFKAGMQLRAAAEKALEKARDFFEKVVKSNEAPDRVIADAERHIRGIDKALDFL